MKSRKIHEKMIAEFVSEKRKSLKVVFWKPKYNFIDATITRSYKDKKTDEWKNLSISLSKADVAALIPLLEEALADWPEFDNIGKDIPLESLPNAVTIAPNDDDIPF